MADLSLLVDYSQVKKANKEITQIGSSAKKSAAVFEAAFKKAEVQQKKSIDAVQKQIAFSKKLEAQKAKEAKAAASAAALVAKEEERLRNKFVEGYTTMNIYTKELNDLAVARKAGIITTQEQAAAVAQLNTQMKAGTGVFANAATGVQTVGKKANRTGVLAQQAGYQFGDFAVQVQSGTNVMVAFGQQATQLIGTFSMLAKSTKAIMAFSALGVLVPILTAVAGAFMRMKSANDEVAESAKRLDNRLNTLKGTLRDYAELQAAMKEGVSLEFKFAAKNVEEAEADLDKAKKALHDTVEQAAAVAMLTGLGGSSYVSSSGVSKAEDKRLAALKAVTEAEKVLADLKAKEADEREEEISEQIHAQESLVNSIKQASSIQAGFYGKTAEEQERLNGEIELHKKLLEAGIKPTNILYQQALKYYNQLVDNKEAVASMTEALGEAAKAQSDLEGLDETYGTQLDIINAQIEALEEGKNVEVAAFIEGERAKISALYETSKAFAIQANDIVALAEASLAFLAAMGELDNLAAAKTKLTGLKGASGGKGGGGSANVVNIRDIIADREKQIQQERVLIGLSGKQRAAQEIYYDLLKQNEDADKKLTEAELLGAAKAIAAQEEQNRVLEEAKEQQNDLAQGIADSMGDAFMSVVDGTKSVKDAFKDMARAIIKQLFEVLVVQRLVGTVGSGNVAGKGLAGLLSGTLTSANGNVFSGGSHVKAYANGGVVGGPTFFPMTGGKTGLMGEAGPEAIMPLKRGPNGKLGVQAEGGSQGNVVVNQSFNFQANGDDSVKRIIAEAAPRIADLTQRQIMDSRRRGGSMKATFG